MTTQESRRIRFIGTVWCDHVDFDSLEHGLQDICRIYCFQKERCPDTKREHYQVYVELKTKMRTTQLVKRFPQSYWKYATQSRGSGWDYCCKEDTRIAGPWSLGERPVTGERSSTDKEALFAEMADPDGPSLAELKRMYPSFVLHMPRGFQEVFNALRGVDDETPTDTMQGLAWREWQEELLNYVQGTPDGRTIRWYYDPAGNAGKTTFAEYLQFELGVDAVARVGSGKAADLALTIGKPSVVIFDLSREKCEHFSYGLLEDLANGRIFSPKFESKYKCFPRPFVVVFSNWLPDTSKLSADRWCILNMRTGDTLTGAKAVEFVEQTLRDRAMTANTDFYGCQGKRFQYNDNRPD